MFSKHWHKFLDQFYSYSGTKILCRISEIRKYNSEQTKRLYNLKMQKAHAISHSSHTMCYETE